MLEIPVQELVTFAFLLGGAFVVMLGFGLRVIYVAFQHQGKERLELFAVALMAIGLFGGFFAWQFFKIIVRM